jgi:hypothetical protein
MFIVEKGCCERIFCGLYRPRQQSYFLNVQKMGLARNDDKKIRYSSPHSISDV